MTVSQTGIRNGRILVSATNSTPNILEKKRLTLIQSEYIIIV